MLDLVIDDVLRLCWTKTMTWWFMALDLMMDLDYGLSVLDWTWIPDLV